MPTTLTVQNLGVTIDRTPLVRDVTFTASAGERIALIGASGSGKSLTAAAIIGASRPPARVHGAITLDTDANTPHQRAVPRFAAAFQDSATALNPLVTVGRQLTQPMLAARTVTAASAREKVHQLLTQLGFDNPATITSRYPGELSGGQRQRAAIALALLCDAPVLVLDEATTALDVVTQQAVVNVVDEHVRDTGRILLFITHDLPVAANLCTRIIVMDHGRVVEDQPRDQLLTAPQHPATISLVEHAMAGVA